MGAHHSLLHASDQASDSTRSQERRRRPNLVKHKEWLYHDRGSSNSNYSPSRTHQRARSHSSDSHTRKPSDKYGYDLTTSDISPERSPRRENQPDHKGVVTSQSLKQQSYKDKKRERDRRPLRQPPGHAPSTRRDAGGSSNVDLQNQVDELKSLLKDISPGQGPVKHNTLLPFSERLRHSKMPVGFRMPKFKTFSGFGNSRNHLKLFDSQLSFSASDDEVYARAFPSSLSKQAFKWFHKLPPNSIDGWQDVGKEADRRRTSSIPQEGTHVGSLAETQRKRILQKTSIEIPSKREGTIRKPLEPMFTNYAPLRTIVGRVYAQVEDKRIFSRPQRIKVPPNRRDQNKYCEYHKDHGHDTNECRTLKAEIERLIRRGQLKEFVKAGQGVSAL
ncbi:hypothetical protein LIER_36324 [Lithospermum erythrorhizon]|uniref:Retrotransposon gag domain-containing protein n=1 Tax=Lithospermum erythrorhizon TaxID=34254 RepID=A0AAV3P4I0_LITER